MKIKLTQQKIHLFKSDSCLVLIIIVMSGFVWIAHHHQNTYQQQDCFDREK